MQLRLTLLATLITFAASAQEQAGFPPLDARNWGVVLDHPGMKDVIVKKDIPYFKDGNGTLNIDVYQPPGLKAGEIRPAVIFLNGIGENPGQPKVKSWEIYKSWPQLMAAHNFIGISMETDGAKVQESIHALFQFLGSQGKTINVDAERLGVYAASANVTQSATYLMKQEAYKGIKAAVLYYGGAPTGPYRKDLPVLFVVAEGDVGRNGYANIWSEVLKNNAPWTIKMATGLPHAFDAFDDSDEARKVVKEAISFWKNHLEVIPPPSFPKSLARDILSAQYFHDDNKQIALLEKWLPDHPDDNRGLFQYASALKNVRRYQDSEVVYRKLLKLEPENVQVLTYLYLLMHQLNRPTEADPFLAAAEKSGRIDKYTYLGMGYTMYSLDKHDQGVKFFEKVVQADPSGINLYNLACGYARIGDKDKAFAALQKSVDAGFTSVQQFESDTDLESLRADARYKAIIEKLSQGSGINTNQPGIRAHHALVYDEESKSILLTAGSTPLNGGNAYKFFNDVWKFDGTKWTQAANAGDRRSGIRMAYDSKQKKIFSYGGYLENGKSAGELRVLENNTWTTLTDLPEMKAAEPGFVYDIQRNKLIAFGGSPGARMSNGIVWEWDGKSWKKFEGEVPSARMGLVMEYDTKRNKMIVYGGGGAQGSFDDTWEFDGKSWKKISDAGPGARVSPGHAYDTKRGLLILFGGVGKEGVLGDTWSWDGKAWKKLADVGPAPRSMGQMAYDKNRDRIVMFGGRLGWPNDANDTWEWDGVRWTEIKTLP